MVMARLKKKVAGFAQKVKKIGSDDPRRIAHSLKVGLALTLVSLFYYVDPLFDGFGVSAMWAVLTVVVVMEYTVGGTLSKGLNRAFATLLAGALGVGAHHLAVLCGDKGQPIVLGCFVFLLAAAATFSRFIPEIKARYDYGVLIFILTFSLVAVSSYRVAELVELAQQRLSTVALGAATCFIVSLFLCPVWAGGDLHDLTALNLEKLGTYLEGLASENFMEKKGEADPGGRSNKPFLLAFKSVLTSKATEETLANLAWWEPAHGRFGFRHPWKQYLKVGATARQCACSIEALNAHVSKSELIQCSSSSSDSKSKLREACREMCSESGKALKELASAIRAMTEPSRAETHVAAAGAVITNNLKAVLLEEHQGSLSEIIHEATLASFLNEVVACTQDVAKATGDLARLAHFERAVLLPKATVSPVSDEEEEVGEHVTITIQK